MVALGIGAMLQGRTYQIGTLSAMGPGFFPVSLGAILTLTGMTIALNAKAGEGGAEHDRRPAQWRAWFLIALSIVAFVVLGKYFGLVPATFAIVFISAFADRQNTWKSALVLAVAIVIMCALVFWWGLQLQFPLFKWGGS